MKTLKIFYCIFPLVCVIGCGGGIPYKLVALEGTASCNGEPIINMVISFTPVDGGKASVGYTDEQGTFVALYNSDYLGVKAGDLTAIFLGPIEGMKTNEAGKKAMEKHGTVETGVKITVKKPTKGYKLDVTSP